jgi:hypothetical protein
LRTAEDWMAFGRELEQGVQPQVETTHRGKLVGLYSRDQTRLRSRDLRDAREIPRSRESVRQR